MRIAIFCLAFILLASGALAQRRFRASFTLTGAARNFGFMTGTVEYDWDNLNIIYSFDRNSYREQYTYNSNRGSVNTLQQYVYAQGAAPVCNGGCSVASLTARMPPLGFSPTSDGFSSAGSATINGQSCTKYTINANNNNPNTVSAVYMTGSFQPCRVEYNNGRVFTFSNVNMGAAVGPFPVPQACTCQKKIDLVLLLDGSGSIDSNEWKGVNNYVRGVINNFDFGPNAAQMAVVQFASSARIELGWTQSKPTLQSFFATNIRQMGGGTDCIRGMSMIRTQLWPSRRPGSIGILITVTDGVDISSPAQITTEINMHKNMGIQIFFGVFIGPANAQPGGQMTADAGGNAARVLRYDNFQALSQGVKDVVAAACDADVQGSTSACGAGCCGFCMCTTCASPNGCDDGDGCTSEALQDTGLGFSCCSTPSPKSCPDQDRCSIGSCSNGNCVQTPRSCTSPDPCKTARCDPSTGCQLDDKCTSNDPCLIPTCSNGQCSTTPKQCQPNERCRTWACSNGNCVATPVNCDDNNPCTADSCSDASGCVHVPQDCVCSCPTPSDVCTERVCRQGTCYETSKCTGQPNKCNRYTGACTLAAGCATAPICDDNDPCTDNHCDPATGACSYTPKCTHTDKCKIPACNNGVCSFTDKQCPPNDACKTFTCNPSTGNCDVSLTNCDDGNPCTSDTCDPSASPPCRHAPQDCSCTCPIPADICNNRGCSQGFCVNQSKCVTSPDPCYTYSGKCDLTNGCEKIPVCKNGDPCLDDVCDGSSGTARCSTKPKCTSSDPCQIPSCAAGTCSLAPKACPASDSCIAWQCSNGACVNTTTDCDDKDDCTADTCDPATGCKHTPQVCNCSCTQPDTACLKWTCSMGQCTSSTKCPAGPSPDPCYVYTGQCVEATGCEKKFSCDDNDPCTVESCVNGQCRTDPLPCDDQDPCTDNICSAGTCTYPPTNCALQTDKCHRATCERDKGGCVFTAFKPEDCDDFNACTDDTCDPAIGCGHTNSTNKCSSGDACYIDSCDPQFGCQATQVNCPGQPKCSFGVCTNGTCGLVKPLLCEEDIIAIGAGLSTAAIIGIVIGIVVCLALAGGAAYKAAQVYNARQDLDKYGQENPLFEKAAIEGSSGIYQGKGDYTRM